MSKFICIFWFVNVIVIKKRFSLDFNDFDLISFNLHLRVMLSDNTKQNEFT